MNDIEYDMVQKHIQGDVEEALRNYNLKVLNIESINND